MSNAVVEFRTQRFTDTITRPADTTAYTAGDVVSEVTTNDHYTFGTAWSSDSDGGVVRSGSVGRSGVINSAKLMSNENQSSFLDAELWLFYSDIAEVADNSAFNPTDAELLTVIGVIEFPSQEWYEGGTNAVCLAQPDLIFSLPTTDGRIFGQLVARNAYTPVASEEFTVELVITQD